MKSAARNKSLETAVIGMLSAIAFVLEVQSVSLPFLPTFLKLDLSDIPPLIGALTIGPVQGVLVCLIKNLFHLLCTTTGGVGELCNFLLGAVFVGITGSLYKRIGGRKAAVTGGVIAALLVSLLSVVLNFYLVYPVYMEVTGIPEDAILAMYQVLDPDIRNLQEALLKVNMPFTFLKEIFSVLLVFFLYKRMIPLLRRIILNKT